jgi:hypothetical protein
MDPSDPTTPAIRRVRGVLFVDYVRMIRGHAAIDWSRYLEDEDAALLVQPIDPDAWYPMATFERFGVGIIREVAGGQLPAVQMWGRFQVESVRVAHPMLIAAGDPRGTLMRFRSMQRGFFDYDAIDVDEVLDDSAIVSAQYGMGVEAERAACHQTLGFVERMIEAAGGTDVVAKFEARGWDGDPRTLISLTWREA